MTGATVKEYKNPEPQLLRVHALTRCNTVFHLWGIDIAISVLAKGYHLTLLGKKTDDLRYVITEATDFVANCYGTKVRKCTTTNPKLKSLPLTSVI